MTELDLIDLLDADLATARGVLVAVSAAVAPPLRRVRGRPHTVALGPCAPSHARVPHAQHRDGGGAHSCCALGARTVASS